MVIILLLLITFSLDDVCLLLGEHTAVDVGHFWDLKG